MSSYSISTVGQRIPPFIRVIQLLLIYVINISISLIDNLLKYIWEYIKDSIMMYFIVKSSFSMNNNFD